MKPIRFYVGTYTRPIRFGTGEVMNGKGKGIYLAELDRETGAMQLLDVYEGVPNPSYLAFGGSGRYLYAVNELKDGQGLTGGRVSSFSIDTDTGTLRFLNDQDTQGADPCHVSVAPGGAYIAVSNYMSGSVAVLPVRQDGSLAPASCLRQHQGSGPNSRRQAGPHAHAAVFTPDGRWLLVPDLGIDQVVCYHLALRDGSLTQQGSYCAPAGSGPRSCVFHPTLPLCYLINELASSISLLSYEAETGTLRHIQTESTLAAPRADNICADVHITPDGRWLFGSNRGEDSLAVFSLDENGKMKRLLCLPCGGKTPRNFALDPCGRYVVVANQDSDNLCSFRLNPETGALTPCGRLEIPSPVCVKMYDDIKRK